MSYYSSSLFQLLNTYLPLVLGLLLAVLAFVLSRYWNREESRYARVEKVIRDFVFLDRGSTDSVVKATLSLPTESIIHLFHSLSTSIKPNSSTNHKLCSIVFHEEVYSRVYTDYSSQTEKSKNLLQETFKHLQNELASPFLQSIIDRSDSSDNDRYQSCLTLLVINPVKSWERILNIPAVVKDIDSIQQDYLTFCNDAIQHYPPTLLSTIVMPHCSRQFFLSLLHQLNEKNKEIALLLISWFPWKGVEIEIANCFIESTTPYPIRRLCVEALQRINSEASAKSLFELIQNQYALHSSSLLQFIFKALYEMKDTGRTYIVLSSRSENPIIRVLAESFLHSD